MFSLTMNYERLFLMKGKEKQTGAKDLNKPFKTGSKQKNRHPVKKEDTIHALIVPKKIRTNCGRMLGRSNISIHEDMGAR